MMVRTLVVAAAFAALVPILPAPAPAEAQGGPRARIWVEDERDFFRRGDRMQVRFTSGYDAYVAVVHIDTDGTLDFLYPTNPWDDGYVRGGRVYSVPQGSYSSWSVRSRPGIGYLYIVASDEPLDFTYFGGPSAGRWDWSFAGRNVRGDPYLALEQITRMLVPDWQYGGYSVDYYSYHVDRRHNYPSYACASSGLGGGVRGWGWTTRYGSCDRLVVFLRQHPGYYDARRFRGDRLVFLQGDALPEVTHGFKAPAREPARGRTLSPAPRGTSSVGASRVRPASPPVEQPSRRRPTLERRGGSQPAAPAQTPRARGSGGGSTRPAQTPRARGSGGGSAKPTAPAPARGSGGGTARPAEEPRTRRSRGGGGGDYLVPNPGPTARTG